MKRLIVILALMLPLKASAQWYLFDLPTPKEEADSTLTCAPDSEAVYSFQAIDCINAVLSLPLSAESAEPNSHMYDFYAGALLAVRDAGLEGRTVKLRTIDSNGSEEKLSEEDCRTADILICPMSIREIEDAQALCPSWKHVVSPLEKIPGNGSGVIQLQTPWTAQIEELAAWVKEDCGRYDDVVIVRQPGRTEQGDTLRHLAHTLDSLGVKYRTSETVLPGHKITGRTRYVTASANVAFLNRTLHRISELNEKGDSLTLYTTSQIRNIRGINDSPSLYKANAHVVSQFEIDRSSSERFESQFRSVFKSEPNRFAFHGYDSMKFFLEMCSEYGRYWPMKLQEKVFRGLQSDFSFDSNLSNCAVRRLVYRDDLSIEIQ